MKIFLKRKLRNKRNGELTSFGVGSPFFFLHFYILIRKLFIFLLVKQIKNKIMETQFATFKPIQLNPNPSKEEIQREYENSNNTLLDKDIATILGLPTIDTTPPKVEIKDTPSNSPKYNIRELLDNNPPESLASPKTIVNSVKPKNRREFLEIYSPMIEEAAIRLNIPKDYMAAQIAFETGWGEHTPGNNVGGIKAFASWKGPKQILKTKEKGKNGLEDRMELFRMYNSIQEGFADYVNLLSTSNKFKSIVGVKDPYQAAQIIGKSGYATGDNYGETIQKLIKEIQQIQSS